MRDVDPLLRTCPHRAALDHLVASHGDDLPLDQAAALLAAEEQPGLDPAAPLGVLDRLAERVAGRRGADLFVQIAALNHLLFVEQGLKGDETTYDDPQNSLIDRVLDRRRGLPILLSLVYVEVGRRIGMKVAGVGFPGHFVVRPTAVDPPFFIDPFNGGRVLREPDMRSLLKRVAGSAEVEPEAWERFIAPVSGLATMQRINNNLKRSWVRRGDMAGAMRATERNLVLDPDSVGDLHDRALLLAQDGQGEAALASLDQALAGRETDPDLACLRALREALQE